jgi:hypothetical protein
MGRGAVVTGTDEEGQVGVAVLPVGDGQLAGDVYLVAEEMDQVETAAAEASAVGKPVRRQEADGR